MLYWCCTAQLLYTYCWIYTTAIQQMTECGVVIEIMYCTAQVGNEVKTLLYHCGDRCCLVIDSTVFILNSDTVYNLVVQWCELIFWWSTLLMWMRCVRKCEWVWVSANAFVCITTVCVCAARIQGIESESNKQFTVD